MRSRDDIVNRDDFPPALTLEDALVMQESLQKKIYGASYDTKTSAWRETLAVSHLLSLIVEASEGIKSLRYRPEWDRHQADPEHLMKEILDQFCFLLNLILLFWGTNSEKFLADWADVWQKNLDRIEEQRGRVAQG